MTKEFNMEKELKEKILKINNAIHGCLEIEKHGDGEYCSYEIFDDDDMNALEVFNLLTGMEITQEAYELLVSADLAWRNSDPNEIEGQPYISFLPEPWGITFFITGTLDEPSLVIGDVALVYEAMREMKNKNDVPLYYPCLKEAEIKDSMKEAFVEYLKIYLNWSEADYDIDDELFEFEGFLNDTLNKE